VVRPDRKVTVGGLVGSIVTITAWIVHEALGFHVPPGVEGAFVVLLTFVVSYWVKNDDINKNQGSNSRGVVGSSSVGKVEDHEVKQ
jgi:hypothetical protein